VSLEGGKANVKVKAVDTTNYLDKTQRYVPGDENLMIVRLSLPGITRRQGDTIRECGRNRICANIRRRSLDDHWVDLHSLQWD
jgi:hypothetical protein